MLLRALWSNSPAARCVSVIALDVRGYSCSDLSLVTTSQNKAEDEGFPMMRASKMPQEMIVKKSDLPAGM